MKLELTESSLIENLQVTTNHFEHLQQAGVKIAIDDFGTGYASLSYIQNFSFDILKIDRSFIANLNLSVKKQAIVGAILQLTKQLNFCVVAEGVETPEELSFLENKGCHFVQGFFLSRPLPPSAWPNFIQIHQNA